MKNAKFVDVGGYRTRYFEAGTGDPVVLVTGGEFGTLMAATEWAPTFDDLRRDFHVIALDKLGQGHTDNPRTPEDYVLETAVRHVYGFIERMELGPVHLVGHSRGGYAVTRIAVDHPAAVRSLTIVDSGSLMHQTAPFWTEVFGRSAAIEDPRERYVFEMEAASYDSATVTNDWIDDVMTYVTSPKYDEARQTVSLVRERLQAEFVTDQNRLHTRIRDGGLRDTPVLVVWAYNDESATVDGCAIPAMHLIMPNVPRSSLHIVNRSGHYPHREQPTEFNATLRQFLASI